MKIIHYHRLLYNFSLLSQTSLDFSISYREVYVITYIVRTDE